MTYRRLILAIFCAACLITFLQGGFEPKPDVGRSGQIVKPRQPTGKPANGTAPPNGKAKAGAIFDLVYLDVGGQAGSKYSYYGDSMNAILKHPLVNSKKSVAQALNGNSSDPLVVAFAHGVSTGVGWLSNAVGETQKEMAAIVRSKGKPNRPIYIAMFVNKVYKELEQKIKLFENSFHEDWVTGKIIFTWSPHASEWSKKYGIPFVFIPFGVDPKKMTPKGPVKPWNERWCDVFVRWDPNPDKYELRKEIDDKLDELGGQGQQFFYWNTPMGNLTVYRPASFLEEKAYLQKMADCRFVASTIGMPGRYDLVGTRYFEVAAAGTSILLVQKRNDINHLAYDDLMIVDGVNTVQFESVDNLAKQVILYHSKPDVSKSIIEEARVWAQDQSWASRAEKIVSAIVELDLSHQTNFQL